jgi:hypothetical protein
MGTVQWTIISAPGTYHPPHVDANGYHTVVQVLDGGAKLWGFARRRKGVPASTPLPGRANIGWQWPAFDDSDILLVALKDGDRA